MDFETARNAGVDFIGVDWGFCGKDFLRAYGAKKIAFNTEDVLRFILG